MSEQLSNSVASGLLNPATNVATSIIVHDASGFPQTGNFRILCDSELMLVTGVSGNTLTVQRAIEGTTAVPHGANASCVVIMTAGGLAQYVTENAGSGQVSSVAGRTGAVVLAYTDISGLSMVAHTGVYADLTGLPTFPSGAIVGTTDSQALTNKTINAASNTVSNLATSMFASNVIDTDGTLAANSDTRLASQKAVKTAIAALTTAVVPDSTNKRYVTDAELAVLAATSGVNTGDQDLSPYALLSGATFLGTVGLSGGDLINVGSIFVQYVKNLGGNVCFYVGSAGELSLGGTGNNGTAGQVLKSQGTGTAPAWLTIATVATTGDYSDLSGKPTLGTAAAEDAGSAINNVPQNLDWYDESDGSTITIDLSVANRCRRVTIAGSRTIAFSNVPAVATPFVLRIQQGGSGSYTITWPGTLKWGTDSGSAPTLETAVGHANTVLFMRTGSGTYDAYHTGNPQ